MSNRNLPFTERLEKVLYTKDGDKYDHRQDPRDVTGTMEADPELARQMEQQGYVVRWAIDGRWRLTDRGFREMERRKALAFNERKIGGIRPFEEDWRDQKARDAHTPKETAEQQRLRNPKLGHDNGNNS